MLLLLISAAFLSLSTGQTTDPVTMASSLISTMISPDLSALAILQATVQSNQELNATSMMPVLKKISEIIESQTGARFSLRLKKITSLQAPDQSGPPLTTGPPQDSWPTSHPSGVN